MAAVILAMPLAKRFHPNENRPAARFYSENGEFLGAYQEDSSGFLLGLCSVRIDAFLGELSQICPT